MQSFDTDNGWIRVPIWSALVVIQGRVIVDDVYLSAIVYLPPDPLD